MLYICCIYVVKLANFHLLSNRVFKKILKGNNSNTFSTDIIFKEFLLLANRDLLNTNKVSIMDTSVSRFEAIVDEIMHFRPSSCAHRNTLNVYFMS